MVAINICMSPDPSLAENDGSIWIFWSSPTEDFSEAVICQIYIRLFTNDHLYFHMHDLFYLHGASRQLLCFSLSKKSCLVLVWLVIGILLCATVKQIITTCYFTMPSLCNNKLVSTTTIAATSNTFVSK